RALQKPLDGRVRRADARTLSLLAQIGLRRRQTDDMEGQAPGRDEALRPLIEEIALDEGAGHEAFQILRRLPLHAGGDFLAEEFKQKVWHGIGFSISLVVPSPQPSPRGRGGPSLLPQGEGGRAKGAAR